MRVLVASDAIAGLSARETSEVIARAFAGEGAQVAVVPLAACGPELADSLREAAPGVTVLAPATVADLADALAAGSDDVVVDLTGAEVDDLGRGLLGEDPAVGLAALRERWAGRRLTALVADGEADLPLTGLSGLAATVGRARGLELADVLAADADAQRWASSLGLAPGPGSGAAGGAGLILQAIGARVTDPLTELTARYELEGTAAAADVVVTGAENLDFHSVGGAVVQHVVGLAGRALRPAIAVVGRNYISARELRLAGLESAYPVSVAAGDDAATVEGLTRVARGVAATWRW